MSAEAKQLVDQAIKENKVLMFGKSWCPVSFVRFSDDLAKEKADGQVLQEGSGYLVEGR